MNPLLIRFWFKAREHFGIGVTAYSLDDAELLIKEANLQINYDILEVIENVDIQTLDQGHVIPNMRPPNFRGIWFPMI